MREGERWEVKRGITRQVEGQEEGPEN